MSLLFCAVNKFFPLPNIQSHVFSGRTIMVLRISVLPVLFRDSFVIKLVISMIKSKAHSNVCLYSSSNPLLYARTKIIVVMIVTFAICLNPFFVKRIYKNR